MAGQLLALRLLSSSRTLLSARVAVAFRLKTLNPSPTPNHVTFLIGSPGGRGFSSRAPRQRDGGRSGLRAAASGGQAKSLIEDEAELSDWVSDLKTDTFRLGLSDSDAGDSGDRKRGGRNERDDRVSRGRDSGGFSDRRTSRGGGGGGFSERGSRGSLLKRRGNSDEEYEGGWRSSRSSSGWRNSPGSGGFSERSHRGPPTKKRFASDLEDEDEEEEEEKEELLSRQSRGRGAPLSFGKRGGGSPRSSSGLRNSRGSGGFSERSHRDPPTKRRFASDLEDEDDEEEEEKEEFLSRQSRGRGAPSSFGKRGVGSGESSYKQGRASLQQMSEEDEDEDGDSDGTAFEFDDDFFGNKESQQKVGKQDSSAKSSHVSDLSDGDNKQPVSARSSEGSSSYLSNTRFDQCSISSLSLKGVQAAGYERMTLVQEATLPVILKGKDVLAKAKTGTGKTVAFLLPAIEIVSKLPLVDRDQKRPPINVLVICPTRELADQAAAEANKLLKFHPSIGVQCVIGGTRLAMEQKRMQTNPCQILVATPGRLRDHIENTPGFATRLMGVKVLVLDEADRLLDMGFRKDIEKIVAAVPKQRQTLLFSATVPDEVRQICYIAMKRDHEFVNTVVEGSEETHSQVRQMHLIAPLEKQFPILYSLLSDHIAEDVDYKVIVFCTTAMVTKLVADLLSELRLNVREIHSRKPQTYRTRVSKEFKESKGLILVSSDVSARGVDYPDVTLVVQVGVPADREQYIHRLGRTGRKGKEGQGILLLAPWEEFFLSSIKNLPITKAPVPLVDPDTRKKVERALAHVEMKNKESAYQAWLGYYNSNKVIGRDKCKLVLLANEFSRSMGLDNPPAITKLVLRKMGLNNVPGLRAK